MSTVAYKDGVLASDTRVTINGTAYESPKIWRSGPRLIGGVGDAEAIELFRRWSDMGAKGADRPDLSSADFAGLVIWRGRCFYLEKKLVGTEITGPYIAIGSGGDFAAALMSEGYSAEDAVCLVIERQLDPNTGGNVAALRAPKRRTRK